MKSAHKATHQGSCQCCGATQKLPDGVLSKHGYNVKWGFFDGVCQGAGHLPYEQSCDLIKGFIAAAEQRAEATEQMIAELLQPATEPKGWYHEYVQARQNRHIGGGYAWRQIELFHAPSAHRPERPLISYMNAQGQAKSFDTFRFDYNQMTLLEAATELNREYVEQFLRPQLKQIREYIRWQQRRVAEWKLADVTPIENGVRP